MKVVHPLLLTLVVASCATTPTWVVEQPGAEPRLAIGSAAPPGTTQSLGVSVELTATLRDGERVATTRSSVALDLRVEVPPEGEALIVQVANVRLLRAGPPIELGGWGLDADLALIGLDGARGVFEPATGTLRGFQAPELPEHRRLASQVALAQLVGGLVPRFPPEPLGAGARWRFGGAPDRCEVRRIERGEAEVACRVETRDPQGTEAHGSWLGFVRPGLPLVIGLSYELTAKGLHPNGVLAERVLIVEGSDD
jgi:hypothetical protein